MKTKNIFGILVLSFALSVSQNVHPAEPEIRDLDPLIQTALENNPRIKAAYEDWKAAEERISQSMSFPDPMASYAHFGESVETRVGPQRNKYGASQKIPFPVKLGLKGRVESAHADMARERYEAAKRDIVKEVKFIYYDLFWVDKAIAVTEQEKGILTTLSRSAQKKFETNLAPQQDVIKADAEISRLIDMIFLFRQNRKSLEARLNSVLNEPGAPPIGMTAEVKPAEFAYTLEELHAFSGESRQELLAAKLDVERARFERSLAQFDYVPDFTLGFDYIQVGDGYTMARDDGKDAWTVGVTVNVPIWFDRLGSQLREKRAALESSRNNYQDMENTVYCEVEDVYFKVLTYRDIISLYETALVPQTEQAFEASRTGYETGRVDFLNWLDAERVLLQTRLAYYKSIVDYQKSIAYLERVVGRDL
jgi:cobalt-zinc-cadmium efflux system outer membrane protein